MLSEIIRQEVASFASGIPLRHCVLTFRFLARFDLILVYKRGSLLRSLDKIGYKDSKMAAWLVARRGCGLLTSLIKGSSSKLLVARTMVRKVLVREYFCYCLHMNIA